MDASHQDSSNHKNVSHSFTSVALLAARGFCPFFNKAVIAESFGPAVQFLIVYNNDIDGEDVLVPMYSEYGSTRLILLSIAHRTGQALKQYIAAQSEEVLAAGGPLIGFDSLPPEGLMTVEDLQNNVLSALGLFFLFVSLSGCVLIWVGRRHAVAASGAWNPLAWLRYRSWTAVTAAKGSQTASMEPNEEKAEQERQTVVIELAEPTSATLT